MSGCLAGLVEFVWFRWLPGNGVFVISMEGRLSVRLTVRVFRFGDDVCTEMGVMCLMELAAF